MIHNDVLNQLQLLIKTSAPPLVEVAQTTTDLPEWVPGQKLPAHVLASLPNGRFQVGVGDHILDMNLPHNTQPGDQIELTFVSHQPRLTFMLAREVPAHNLLAAAADAKSSSSLSDTARLLGAVLQKVGERQTDPQAAPLARAMPLAPGGPADIKDLAVALRGALSQSGLFYESHQAQWANGERPLSDLLREPQGHLPPPDAAQPASQPAGAARAPEPAAPPVASASAPTTGNTLPVHPDTVPLVQQQLQALDTRQLLWQGQVWPGQVMDWQVEEQPPRGEDDPEQPAWKTRLRLHLPRMGTVSATLAFASQGLRVSLKAADVATAGQLQGARGQLQDALDVAGLRPLGVTVECDGKA